MKFIDKVKIEVFAGNGGNGLVAFEKGIKTAKRPSGGSGGAGGDVVIIGDEKLYTLDYLTNNQKYFAEKGKDGRNNNCTGAKGENIIIYVPFGTKITIIEQNRFFYINENNFSQTILKGGAGGRGNCAFGHNYNENHENGAEGEISTVLIEALIVADVAFIGKPSVGKTSLLNKLISTNFRVGVYDFTTLTPNIGVDKVHYENDVKYCDIPGIIKDAHIDKGLGIYFLRHVQLCKVLLYIIKLDLSLENFFQDYLDVYNEVKLFNSKLLNKPQLIIINVFNDVLFQEHQNEIKKFFKNQNLFCFFYNIDREQKFNVFLSHVKDLLLVDQSDKSLKAKYTGINAFRYYIKNVPLEIDIKKVKNHEFEISGSVINEITKTLVCDNLDNFNLIIKQLKKLKLFKFFKKNGIENKDFVIVNNKKFIFNY